MTLHDKQAEYEDASTLPTRINRHCLLLATRKAAKPVAPHDDTLAPPPSVTGRRSQAMMADPRLPANSVQGMKAWDGARTRNPLYSGGITGQDEMYSSTETAVNAPDGVRRQAQGEDRNSPHREYLSHAKSRNLSDVCVECGDHEIPVGREYLPETNTSGVEV